MGGLITTMTEDAIYNELEHIKEDIKEIKEALQKYPSRIKEIIEIHCQLCGAARFFNDNKLKDNLFNTIYKVSEYEKNKEKKGVWLRWILSLPVAGLIIERIIQVFNKGN